MWCCPQARSPILANPDPGERTKTFAVKFADHGVTPVFEDSRSLKRDTLHAQRRDARDTLSKSRQRHRESRLAGIDSWQEDVAPQSPGKRMSLISSTLRKRVVKRTAEAADEEKKNPECHTTATDSLNKRLQKLGMVMREMEGDGNCQFRAFADQLFGDQRHHATVRQSAVEHIRAHADFFGMYFDGPRELNRYVSDMSRNRTWGDELTMRAVVEAYGCKVHLITSEPANWYMVYTDENGDHKVTGRMPRDGAMRSSFGLGKEIFVSYISPIHYNVIDACV